MSRPVRLLLAAAVAATTIGGLGLTALGQPAGAAATSVDSVRLNGFEAALARDINRARVNDGLRPLVVTAGTTDVARRWSWRMAHRQVLSHNPALVHDVAHAGSGSWRAIAENVGDGPSDDPHMLFDAYMHSAPHRANILDRDMRYLGVGVVQRGGIAWNTLDFVDAYGSTYGEPRVPAAGLTMDAHRIASTTDVASLEAGVDQRFTAHRHGSVRASHLRFTGPSSRNDAAVSVLHRRGSHAGHATVLMRDALDLSRADRLSLQLSARNAAGRTVPVHVSVRREFGRHVDLGTVWVHPGSRTTSLRLPARARGFRTSIVLRVSGRAVSRAGGRVRLAVYDVRADV